MDSIGTVSDLHAVLLSGWWKTGAGGLCARPQHRRVSRYARLFELPRRFNAVLNRTKAFYSGHRAEGPGFNKSVWLAIPCPCMIGLPPKPLAGLGLHPRAVRTGHHSVPGGV